jgi:hypothetical protein
MAGVETYGGCCPECLKGMLQKWESSNSGFMFDACPWCGFIYSEGIEGKTKEEVWNEILVHHSVKTREELIKRMNYEMYVNRENSDFYPSIFGYVKDQGTHWMYDLFWKEKDKVLKGTKVFWEEKEKRLGTLMEYENGKIKILWDDRKDSKLPYNEYDAIEFAGKIQLV